MSASRSASPSGSEAGDIVMESPRAKLKRELAAFDSSSDEDNSQSPAKRQKVPTRKPMPPTKSTPADDSEEEDDEVVIARPRGRLASRMQAANPDTQDTPIPSTEQDAHIADEEAEDEDIRARKRLRQRRLGRRSKTPRTNAQATPQPITPGLFVSPEKRTSSETGDNASDDELPSLKNVKLAALLDRKRKEREAKEAEEEKKIQEREQRIVSEVDLDSASDNPSDITDDEGGRQLTQKAHPTRKASKKAIEEMNRETQRMDRNRQLAHHCQTKKKITKNVLFDRFNFMTGPPVPEEKAANPDKVLARSSRPSSPASHQSDAEMRQSSTPPTSPPKEGDKPSEAVPTQQPRENAIIPNMDDDLPSLEEFISKPKADNKGKGKAPHIEVDLDAEKPEEPKSVLPRVRVKLPANIEANLITLDDDDDDEDLVIIKPAPISKFDQQVARLPKKKSSHNDYVLDRLVQAVSPVKQRGRRGQQKNSMTAAELQASLMQRAREQARLEREQRIEMLKAKGVIIETEEERLKLEEQVDDIVARARREAEEIMDREREAAKKEKKEQKAGDDPLAWDDSDDESYEASDEDQEEKEIELSGSEEEDEGDEEEEAERSEVEEADNPMFDDAAEEDEDATEEENADDTKEDADDDEETVPATNARRSRKRVRVIADDEDEADGMELIKATPKPKATPFKVPNTDSSHGKTPTSVLRSATKPFIPGLPIPVAAPAGLGLTQMFQGTMDDSQADSQSQAFQGAPVNTAPIPSITEFPFNSQTQTQEECVADSQGPAASQAGEEETSQPVEFNLEQTQMHGFDSIWQGEQAQMDLDMEIPTPTQDEGFVKFTPLKDRFMDAPAATMPTVDGEDMRSPLFRRKGKLRRRAEVAAPAAGTVSDGDDEEGIPETAPIMEEENEFAAATTINTGGGSNDANAFAEMRKAARKAKKLAAFKKKSRAREMVEDQAEESEDEYAGLGGADGEDSSDAEEDEEVKAMIDDNGASALDEAAERRLAAFHADREREADERQVDKLFKDITTGQLRKRRAGGRDFDLSDSDDGGEARRRAKRRQFQKLQRELFKDERISKVAENPKSIAFLKSIEDIGSDDEGDFLAFADEGSQGVSGESESQSQGQQDVVPDSQPKTGGSERPTLDQGSVGSGNPRRTRERNHHMSKPRDLNAIRDSLSDLLDDPHTVTVIPASVEEDDSSDEDNVEIEIEHQATGPISNSGSSDKENSRPSTTSKPPHPRRTSTIVDRISLSRQSSSSSSISSNGPAGGRLAFAAPASSMGVKGVPALLRRATTNSSLLSAATAGGNNKSNSNASSSVPGNQHEGGTTTTAGGFGEESKIKRNAGKTSGINYFARENERRAALKERETKRQARRMKGVMDRSKVVSGLFGKGNFE